MKRFGSFGLDTENECLRKGEAAIALPPKPFAVLRYLVEHPARLITHDELLDALWPETYVQPQVLRTYMLDLRKALGDDAGQPLYIQTVPKRGYRFVAAVAEPGAGAQAAVEPETRLEAKAALKPIVRQSSHPPLARIVNRLEETESLRSYFALAEEGKRQVVFVIGDAGIGKTALVDAFLESLSDGEDCASRASLARGQCVEGLSRREPYYPVTEALRQLCACAEGAAACKILARMAPDWLAALGREGAGEAHAGLRERMPGDLCAALEELAAETPVVLAFEDLQWADEATLHLISALARRRVAARLLVVATFRPRDVAAEHPLREIKHDLRMRRLCAEIALAPFEKQAVKDLLIRELGQEELPPGLSSFVHRRSEGNPLFVIAIVEHLQAQEFLKRSASGDWIQTAGISEMEASLPEGLAQMIELEVARLGEPEQKLLEAGSLMQIAFPSWAVAAALQMDRIDAEEALQELARRLYFVERAGQDELPDGTESTFYVFAHGLYREVLLRRQTEARRARRHIRIAARLAELFRGREGSVAREMAVHFVAAGDWQQAMGALRSGARFARQRQALAEAQELLDQALELTEHLRDGERKVAAREISVELESVREAFAQTSEQSRSELQKA